VDPAHGARHAVDRDDRPLGNPPGRVADTEHRRNTSLAREGGQVRRATPELRDDTGDTRQHGRQRRTGDLRDEDVAELDVLEIVLVEHDARRARRPAHTRRLTRETGMPEPHFVGRVLGLDVERPRLKDVEAALVLRPLDLDGPADEGLDSRDEPPELHHLRRRQTRGMNELRGDRLRPGAARG